MEGCGWVFVAILAMAAVATILQAKARQRAFGEYQASLAYLKRDPTNPNLREETLRLGRAYSNLTRNRRGVTLFDEVALMNDINAACAAAAQPQRALPPRTPAQPIETRLARLSELRAKGLIDEAEYAERRRQILNEL